MDESTDLVVPEKQRNIVVLYSTELADNLLDYFIEGKSLLAISKLDGMPSYSGIMKWARTNDEFRNKLLAARVTRALAMEDKILQLSEDAGDLHKDDVNAYRLKFDAMKWMAEVNDPNTYGKKTTVQGDPNKPIQIIVKTGVPDPLPHQQAPKLDSTGIIEATSCVIEESAVTIDAQGRLFDESGNPNTDI